MGNLDCTFCLDCVHACPYDNVGLLVRTPTAELWRDPFRSGIGRLSQRADLAVLVVLFTFASLVNAFAMIPPVYAVQDALAGWLKTGSRAPGLALIFLVGLGILPAAAVVAAGWASRALAGRGSEPLRQTLGRYVYALVPVGFGMWLAHYAFHFLTGALTAVPVAQSFLADIGLWAGRPNWSLGPLVPYGWLFPIEAALLYLGAFGSLVAVFQIAREREGDGVSDRPRVLGAALPWLLLILLLLAAGLWILVQPMEMRGTDAFARLVVPGGYWRGWAL